MKASVLQFIKECDTCQCNKHESLAPPGLLDPLLIPEKAWKDIFMNFIEGLYIKMVKL